MQGFIAAAEYGLAQVAAAQGDIAEARRLGQESLALYTIIPHHTANEVKRWLEHLPRKGGVGEKR